MFVEDAADVADPIEETTEWWRFGWFHGAGGGAAICEAVVAEVPTICGAVVEGAAPCGGGRGREGGSAIRGAWCAKVRVLMLMLLMLMRMVMLLAVSGVVLMVLLVGWMVLLWAEKCLLGRAGGPTNHGAVAGVAGPDGRDRGRAGRGGGSGKVVRR